jgi:cytochrome c oxidase subunit III
MTTTSHVAHRDDYGAKLGMWLFLVTEINLFGGLFIAYAYMRNKYPSDFHHAGANLNAILGITNTIVLLTSSLTVVLAIAAIQEAKPQRALRLLITTILLGVTFLIIKAFEWNVKFHHGIYPSSPHLATFPHGEQIFYGLYFTMTGLHGLHVLIGVSVLAVIARMVGTSKVTQDHYVLLENGGLYWHLVDVVWIFLLPLFYLAA